MTIGMEVTAALRIVTAIRHLTVHRDQIVLDFVVLAAHAGGLSALIAVGMRDATITISLAALAESGPCGAGQKHPLQFYHVQQHNMHASISFCEDII